MAKKIRYSRPLETYWTDLYSKHKRLMPTLSDDEVFTIVRDGLLKSPLASGETQEVRNLNLQGWNLWKTDNKGEMLHVFFLEQRLRAFLSETPLSDLMSLREFLLTHGKQQVVQYVKSKTSENTVIYSFAIHIPYESQGYAFEITLKEDETIELYFNQGQISGALNDKFYHELDKSDNQESLEIGRMFRLAINTLAYMRCFPECVTDGVPSRLLEKNERLAKQNVTFEISSKIIEHNLNPKSKIPHFRKGYFKVLKSDFYTKMKGQIVYVSETMVKAKAKTVATSPTIQSDPTN